MNGGAGRGIGDTGGNPPPWASVFDPVANLRSLSDVQAEGMRAAGNLVDRFIRTAAKGIEEATRGASAEPTLSGDDRSDLFGATDVEPLMRSWWSMVGQLYLGNQPSTSAPPATGQVALDFARSAASGRLEFEAVAGGAASSELWLHNRGVADLGHVHLRCSDLLSDHGRVLGADAVKLDPEIVPMPARSSRGIEIRIEVPVDHPAGVYRGSLLAEGYPHLWLPVLLAVRVPHS